MRGDQIYLARVQATAAPIRTYEAFMMYSANYDPRNKSAAPTPPNSGVDIQSRFCIYSRTTR